MWKNLETLFRRRKLLVPSSFLQWGNNATKPRIKKADKIAGFFKSHQTRVVNTKLIHHTNTKAKRLKGNIQEPKIIDIRDRIFTDFRNIIFISNSELTYIHTNSRLELFIIIN
jgi:hypothetical protein